MTTPVPADVVAAVEQYITDELAHAVKYDNREPLDESGCFSLHRLAEFVYAKGWDAGSRAEAERARGTARRARPA